MKIIFEIFGTLASTVAVVHTEYLQFRPLVIRDSGCLRGGLNDIEYNGYSVLVGFSNSPHVRISRECLHRTECFRAHFTSLEKWQGTLRLILEKKLSNCRFHVFWGILSFCATVRGLMLLNLGRHHWLHYYREVWSLLETARRFRCLHLGWDRWLRRRPVGLAEKIRHRMRAERTRTIMARYHGVVVNETSRTMQLSSVWCQHGASLWCCQCLLLGLT